jgi:hypothetical protein
MKNMGQKKSNWELVIAHSSLPPKAESKAESKSDDIVPEEKDSFSLYSFFSNLWTKDASAELNPLLSGSKIGPNNSK